jgi:uncharacterized protein (TIGR01777 family)
MYMSNKVLITGGSGLVGSRLSALLAQKGYEVVHLSRFSSKSTQYKTFTWDLAGHIIEEGAFEGVSHVIHLAGAGVADKKWSAKRKKVLASSRIDSADLIFQYLKNSDHKIEAFISASAIGIYGYDTGGIVQAEDRVRLGDDFLATLCKEWEASADRFAELGARVLKLRIGLVLSKDGGLLGKLVPLTKWGLSAAFGSGEQYMSWIDIRDLINMFAWSVEQRELHGTFNAVAPNPVSNKEFLKKLSKVLNRPYFLPNIPKFVLNLVLGELASAITGGNNVSSKKIEESGFKFQYDNLEDSLRDLLG